jgi:hypothetical protein
MKKRCPFCHGEVEIPEALEASAFCGCGAYGQVTLLSNAHSFLEGAKRALRIEAGRMGRVIEVVDGGILFEGKEEPAIIQWAKKPK